MAAVVAGSEIVIGGRGTGVAAAAHSVTPATGFSNSHNSSAIDNNTDNNNMPPSSATTVFAIGVQDQEDPSESSAARCVRFRFANTEREESRRQAVSKDCDRKGTASDASFGPTYTHQIFGTEEIIPGYRPPEDRVPSAYGENNKNKQQHSSYRRQQPDDVELDVCVVLSPSCRSCSVTIAAATDDNGGKGGAAAKRVLRRRRSSASLVRTTAAHPNRVSKKPKLETNDEDRPNSNGGVEHEKEVYEDEEEELDEDDREEDDSNSTEDEFVPDDESGDEEDEDDDGARLGGEDAFGVDVEDDIPERVERLSVEEIRERLRKGLPRITEDGCNLSDDVLLEPIGTVLSEYEHKGQEFCLTLCTGAECASYHEQVQRLALFFIETADDVDVSDTKDGSWDVMYLFCKKKRIKRKSPRSRGRKQQQQQQHHHEYEYEYWLAGYFTLFSVRSPFRKPQPGTVLRICQALLLPPYQRAGHGRRMLHAVHDEYLAAGKARRATGYDPVVQINVEDPAPGFCLLRLGVDYERFLRKQRELKKEWFWNRNLFAECMVANNKKQKGFAPLPESRAAQAAAELKITSKQIHCIYELDTLSQIEEYRKNLASSSTPDDVAAIEELEKGYRLMVKKRLNRLHQEEMAAVCRSKKEMQDYLTQLFDEKLAEYRSVLKTATDTASI